MEEKKTLTVVEAARYLGTGRNQTYAAIRTGEIPSIRIGSRILVPKAALDDMLSRPPKATPSVVNFREPVVRKVLININLLEPDFDRLKGEATNRGMSLRGCAVALILEGLNK